MFSISPFALSRLNNAEFVGFFINFNQLVEKTGSEKLGLDSGDMQNFAELLKKLQDQVRYSPSSALTASMVAANDKRCQIFKRINYHLKAVQLAEENTDLLACRDVVETQLLKPYPLGIVRLPYQELTTVLSGFIMDCKNKLDEDAIDVLGVMSDITALEMANNAFISAYNSRSAERSENAGLTLELRKQMNDLYLGFTFHLQYVANSKLSTMADKAAAIQPFIAVLNANIADARRRYNQRINALHNGEEPMEDPDDEDIHGGGDEGGNTQKPSGGDSGNQQPSGGGGQQQGGGNTGNGDGDPIDNGSSVIF